MSRLPRSSVRGTCAPATSGRWLTIFSRGSRAIPSASTSIGHAIWSSSSTKSRSSQAPDCCCLPTRLKPMLPSPAVPTWSVSWTTRSTIQARRLKPRRSIRPSATCQPSPAVVCSFSRRAAFTLPAWMKSNVKLYVEAGAVIKGSTKNADYVLPPGTTGGRGRVQRALFVFNNVENAGLMGRGNVDMQGYPWLWHDLQPDTGDGKARTPEGLANDPHGNGVKGYVINSCKNVTFQDLFLLRSAYWTVTVSNTDGFTSRNIKLINPKQQYHDDAYDLTGGSKH